MEVKIKDLIFIAVAVVLAFAFLRGRQVNVTNPVPVPEVTGHLKIAEPVKRPVDVEIDHRWDKMPNHGKPA